MITWGQRWNTPEHRDWEGLHAMEEQFHPDCISPPPGWCCSAMGVTLPLVPPPPQRPQHRMLPERPTQLLQDGDFWGNLWGSSTGDQIETERGAGFTAIRLISWWTTFHLQEHPSRVTCQWRCPDVEPSRWPACPGSVVGRPAWFGFASMGCISCGVQIYRAAQLWKITLSPALPGSLAWEPGQLWSLSFLHLC